MKKTMKTAMMIVVLEVMAGSISGSVHRGDLVRSNVLEKVRTVYADGNVSADEDTINRRFLGVRGGGVHNELEGIGLVAFSNLCAVVSNDAVFIVNSWNSYATNECVRFSVLCAAGFSGCNFFTNFTDRIVSFYESPNGAALDCRYSDLRFLMSPYGTPMERYFVNSFDQEGVSNLLVRVSSILGRQSSTNDLAWCNRILSGERKRIYEQEQADGGR